MREKKKKEKGVGGSSTWFVKLNAIERHAALIVHQRHLYFDPQNRGGTHKLNAIFFNFFFLN